MILWHNELMRFICFFTFIFNIQLEASKISDLDRSGVFSGRISQIEREQQRLRVRLDFANAKFIQLNDEMQMWHQGQTKNKCKVKVVGKENHYVQLRVPQYNRCVNQVGFTVGSYILFSSRDLEFNMLRAREMIELLLKKRAVLAAELKEKKGKLEEVDGQINGINSEYDQRIQEIEKEREQVLGNMTEKRVLLFEDLRDDELTIGDIDYKLERFRVQSENMSIDRWSLDPELHFKK